MLGNSFFKHDLLMRYIAVFGTLFNDLQVQRTDANGVVTQTIPVKIDYGPRSSSISREDQDPTFRRPASVVLPRISYEIESINYDPVRARNATNTWTNSNSTSLMNRTARANAMNLVPYELVFSLTVYVQNEMDGFQIVEQILPYFQPDFTPRIRLVEELNLEMDCPIVFNGITFDDNYEGQIENSRRVIQWRLDFVMKAVFVGPVATAKVIKFADIKLFQDETSFDDNHVLESVTVQPGLTVDGLPTNNAYQTIPYRYINADDNYGYVVNVVLNGATLGGESVLGSIDFSTDLNGSYAALFTEI